MRLNVCSSENQETPQIRVQSDASEAQTAGAGCRSGRSVPGEPVPSPEQAPQAAAALLQPRLSAASCSPGQGQGDAGEEAPGLCSASRERLGAPPHCRQRMLVPSTSQDRDKGSSS